MTPIPPAVARIAELLSSFGPKWYVAGGWAVDASLGRKTREHEDIEIAIFRKDQRALFDYLDGWTREYVRPREGSPGEVLPWSGERLELPMHEIWARSSGFDLEVLLDERSGRDWVFRRDPRVTLPLSSLAVESDWGLPVLVPEIVLLYKAKNPRDRDELDFQTLPPHLTQKQSYWLWEAISLVHPGHPWLGPLSR
ncbi:MAG: hypothetical protein M3550_16335 [Actinomycetota bacterium]|nr:hypothetical protein [Actinomycetota bacterium]